MLEEPPLLNQEMKHYLDTFLEETQRYQHPPILFQSPPSSLEDALPGLESLEGTAQQRSTNVLFINHRQRLGQITELVERLGEHLDPTFQELRQTFFLQLGLHMRLVGALVESQWEAEKMKLGFSQTGTDGEQPEIVDTCASTAKPF